MKKKKEGVGTDNLKLGLEQDIQKSANNFACTEESIDFIRISNFEFRCSEWASRQALHFLSILATCHLITK